MARIHGDHLLEYMEEIFEARSLGHSQRIEHSKCNLNELESVFVVKPAHHVRLDHVSG